ncbi:MAG TPA: class I SAM-dependent methyltransferase [Patescibacteria group bacterium]|nr:class I SAM-dependent methyltransferase [Patescibacteria group bacterium]
MNTNSPNDNALTLQSYQDKAQEYVDGTPPIDDTIKAWLDTSLSLIPANGKILEVGSGFGRDADYVQQKGFDIECSDAVPNFVNMLQEKGFKAHRLDLLADNDFGNDYDMILADAVLLHFTPEQATAVTQKIHRALTDNGIFALRMKQGDGPVWSEEKLGEPRYFYYWKIEDLKNMLIDCRFQWISMTESYTSHNNANWLHIVLRKS